MKPHLLFLMFCLLIPALPQAWAQGGPTPFDPDLPGPTPPIVRLAESEGASPAQSSLRCTAVLADPTISQPPDVSPWRSYAPGWTFSADTFFSPPWSLHFFTVGAATGQEIAIPTNLAEIYGAVRYRFAPGASVSGEHMQVELYETGFRNLIARIVLDTVSDGDGAWRSAEWEVTDAATVRRLRELGRAIVLFTAIGRPIWLDDISAGVCEPASSISGQVTQGATPAVGAAVLLTRHATAGARLMAQALTDADGGYRFALVPPPPPETHYQVWVRPNLNAPTLERERLGLWAGPRINRLVADGDTNLAAFDVANIRLERPEPFATVVATDAQPATFTWSGRNRPGERHRFCLYDPQRADPETGQPVQLCGPLVDPSREPLAFKLGPASFAGAPSFPFAYGRSYRWYVIVYDRDPRTDANFQYGYSLFERAVTFLPEAAPAPPAPPTPDPGDPAEGAIQANWNLLIYIAADNALGDPQRAPRSARPAGQLTDLPELTAAHPGVRALSLVDEYGPGGLRLCVYAPGAAPDCRLRPEANSANPETLASFIRFGRERYPAARTALLIVAPAQAAGLLALDETDGGAALSLDGLQAAYATAGLGNNQRLDLVIYQAPLLATFDALRVTAPYARYVAAFADPIWQLGPYAQLIPALSRASNDPAAAAVETVNAYNATVDRYGSNLARSLIACDMARFEQLAQSVDALATALHGAINTDRERTLPLVAAARAASQVYDTSGNGRHDQMATTDGRTVAVEEDALVDLRDLAKRLRDSAGVDEVIRNAAANLVRLLEDRAASPLVASVQRSGRGPGGTSLDLEQAAGLAIFFPGGDRLGGQPALTAAYLYGGQGNTPNTGAWARMLRTYLEATLGSGPGGITEGPEGAPRFQPLPGGLIETDVWLPLVRQ